MKVLRFLIIAVTLVLIGACSSDDNPTSTSTAPTITSVTPSTLNRGQSHVTVNIGGTNFISVSSVSLGPDITIHGFRAVSASNVELDVSVSRNATPGNRTISLTAQGGSVSSGSLFSIQSNVLPLASFTIRPNGGSENDEFEFDASGSSDDNRITEYLWDFHDGNGSATGKIVKRKFAAGTYQVDLTVTDNDGESDSKTRELRVSKSTETECTQFSSNRGLLYGTVIDVEPGNNAIVKLDRPNSTCKNSFYVCGDMRNAEVDLGFYGIIQAMTYLGDNTFRIKNGCPFKWPPHKGSRVFLFFKHCSVNFCP